MTHGGGERDGLNEEADERARNELMFTTERFRRLGVTTAPIFNINPSLPNNRIQEDYGTRAARMFGFNPDLPSRDAEIPPERTESERIQYLMDITRSLSPPPERQEEAEAEPSQTPSAGSDRMGDLELIATHASVVGLGLPPEMVELAYEENNGELVNTLMDLTEPVVRRRLEQQLAERQEAQEEEEESESESESEGEWVEGEFNPFDDGGGSDSGEDDEEALPEDRRLAIARVRHETRRDTLRRMESRRIADDVLANANVASIEDAMARAQDALARSDETVAYSADWQPSVHDWARLSATATEDGYSGGGGHATRTQHERNARLHELLRSTQIENGSIHDAGASGELRDLVYPTLEWRMAWAHQRHHYSDESWALEDHEWYRAIAMLVERYPDRCRRNNPYRGQAPDDDDVFGEILWLEWLAKAHSAAAYGNRERLQVEVAEQQRRTEEVQRKLACLGSHPLFGAEASFPATRNRIRALMRDTMVNLRPGARQWPDPIWGHVLSLVRKWDEEMLSMRSTQQRAAQIRGGRADAIIEAHASLMSVADMEHGHSEVLDAVARFSSARDARQHSDERPYEWPRWEQQLEEVAASEATATEAEVARVSAERVAVPLAEAAVRAMDRGAAGANAIFRASADYGFGRTDRARLIARMGRGMRASPWLNQVTEQRAFEQEQQRAVIATATATYARPRAWVDRVGITERREALEAQMENGELTEGVYLERMNALRDEYNGAPPPPERRRAPPRNFPASIPPRRREESHIIVTNNGPLGIRTRDETDSMWFNGNRSALSDRSWAHIEQRPPEPPNEDIPDAD